MSEFDWARDLTVNEYEWAREQTCSPLYDNQQVAIAKLFASTLGLPLHDDRWKNWDNFLAVYHANRLTKDKDAPILDAGACRDLTYSPSVFLPGLKKLGFTSLHGCNLDEGPPVEEDDILYQYADITETSYLDGQFAFVACLSVIEHGVDWRRFFPEMARILKVGGHLFVSFDYWDESVDTFGQKAFGVPIVIFTANDVMNMALHAKAYGLHLMKRPDLRCRERPVEWMGIRYTFMNLLFEKVREPTMNAVAAA